MEGAVLSGKLAAKAITADYSTSTQVDNKTPAIAI
jgi:hypothetical protein